MILYRYMLREFFRFTSGTLVLCLFFFILFDFIQKTTAYLGKYNPSAQLLIEYYLLQVPFELYQAIPIASLVASVVVMILLARSGEATAMRAVGMSPLRLISPLVVGGFILSVTSFLLGEFVIPYTTRRAHFIKQVRIEGEDAGINEGAHWIRSPDFVVNFKAYDTVKQSLESVKILYVSKENFAPFKIINAKTALYAPSDKNWMLSQVKIFELDEAHRLSQTHSLSHLKMELPIEPKRLMFDRRTPFELSLWEINRVLETGQQRSDVVSYHIAWHMKFGYPFAALLISFLGLRFGYRTERTSETIRSMLLALALALSYWFILSASKALCASGTLHPFFAGWLANAWIAIIIVWQFLTLDRETR